MIRKAEKTEAGSVVELLKEASLPVAGVEDHFEDFLVARDEDGCLVGCIGLEDYGGVGLLRSLAVSDEKRGSGIGGALVERLCDLARSRGIETLYLLTTTADAYFPRFGFERIDRAEADPRLQASEELRGACPASAVLMRRSL